MKRRDIRFSDRTVSLAFLDIEETFGSTVRVPRTHSGYDPFVCRSVSWPSALGASPADNVFVYKI